MHQPADTLVFIPGCPSVGPDPCRCFHFKVQLDCEVQLLWILTLRRPVQRLVSLSFFMSEVQFGHRLCEKFFVLIVKGEHRSEMIDGVLRSRLLKGRGDYTAFRYCFSLTLIYISA